MYYKNRKFDMQIYTSLTPGAKPSKKYAAILNAKFLGGDEGSNYCMCKIGCYIAAIRSVVYFFNV